ncbi:MAG: hypothetical protein EOO24_21620, partial [Comamonadaceae bacterium]
MTERLKLAPDAVRQLTYGKRFLAADRAGLDAREIGTWDKHLLREHRLLVPVDVQALYVAAGSTEPMVRLPMLVAGADGHGVADPEDGMPDPFTEGKPRDAGVHLHWAMPDALLRGTLDTRTDGSTNRLALPLLPDRWVVLRILLPRGGREVLTTGWVLEADRAVATPLGSWTEGGQPKASGLGETIPPERLTGTVGGALNWAGVYDAVRNRFAFHDPLADIAALAPQGVDEDCATYLVAGWWRDAAHDPLDAARSSQSLDGLLARLRWGLLRPWGDENWARDQERAQAELRHALGLTTQDRWAGKRPASAPPKTVAPAPRTGVATAAAATAAAAAAAARAPAQPFVPVDRTFMEAQTLTAASTFAADAARRFVAPPWQLRSSLLHGAIYGVPVAGEPLQDRRPDAGGLAVAFGQHEDEMLAALSAAPQATPEQRRASERLLTAFTAQKIDRLGSPDGLVELEEHEHAAGFSSVPAGIDGDDRYLQRVQTGGAGGRNVGKYRGTQGAAAQGLGKGLDGRPGAAKALDAATSFSSKSRPALVGATATMVNDIARSRTGDVLAPTEARVVKRPAARFTFPDAPMVAIRGARRSLRHGGDGRGSANGTLTCRWPTHVIQEIAGVVAPDRFVRSLGSGAVPSEVLALAREAVLHDPYHDGWIADAVAPSKGERGAIFNRLRAESVLRFGSSGTYDGATVAFDPQVAQTADARRAQAAAPNPPIAPERRQQQRMVADAVRKFSLYKGVDPDLVGVTTWV